MRPTREQLEQARERVKALCESGRAGDAVYFCHADMQAFAVLLAATAEPSEQAWLIAHVAGEDAGYSVYNNEAQARELFKDVCRESDVDDAFLCRVVARRVGAK